MPELGRRALLGGIAAGATGIVTGSPAGAAPTVMPITVTPTEPRYVDMVSGFNARWVGSPERIRMIQSTVDAVAAVGEAAATNRRISVRSGGHCFEDFVHNPDVQVVLDMSTMNEIRFDPTRNAFEVAAGANLLHVYNTLYHRWGVTIPGGTFHSVGMGGHATGGGHGLLSRQHGLVCDYIDAVEVVVVDAAGKADAVVASSDPADPNHDLWWAHTGGGGGNFGVVTRFWLRAPGATGTDPRTLLPAPPATVLLNTAAVPWSAVDEAGFRLLLRNYIAWHHANSAPGTPGTALSTLFGINHVAAGALTLITQVDATTPNARNLLTEHLAAIGAGAATEVRQALTAAPTTITWGEATRYIAITGATGPVLRSKAKSAYLKGDLTDTQLDALYTQLHSTDITAAGSGVLVFPHGGAVNAIDPHATAAAQRDSVLLFAPTCMWVDPAQDELHVNWIRTLFQNLFATTGGVPVPGEDWDGCYINYPDVDMADSTQNTSGVPWSTLYYKDNYPRLQKAKARWDPGNVFRHTLSVQPPTQ